MIDITTAVEHDSVDALCLGALCNQLADLAGSFLVAGSAFEFLVKSGCGNQRDAIDVVNDLCVDVRIAAIDIQARSFGRAGDLAAHSGVALHALCIFIKRFNHYGTPPNYFLPPALPSLWRMTSVVYLIPLPL